MRHLLAHHVPKHHELRSGILADSKAQELEADDQATTWTKGDTQRNRRGNSVPGLLRPRMN